MRFFCFQTLILASFLFFQNSFSQNFTGSGGSIGADVEQHCFSVNVSGLPLSVNAGFGLETVCINLLHSWDSDLDILLFSPDGSNIILSSDNGFDGDSYLNTCFSADAPQHISFGYAPMSGSFRPEGRLGNLNNGQNPNGIWQICLTDDHLDDQIGQLLDWTISFSDNPAPPPLLPDQSFTAVFESPDDIIPSDGTLKCFTIEVSGLPDLMDLNYGFSSICLNITHTWDEDVSSRLISPNGTEVWLTHYNGGSGDNFINTCFSMSGTQPISTGGAPFTGTFIPLGNLSDFNNGQNPNGTWQLCIYDNYAYVDDGVLHDFTLTFSETPSETVNPYLTFTQSNLPIMVIQTNGQQIVDSPRIEADMGIVDNASGLNFLTDPFNGYDGKITIEIRGTSSQSFPKKGYGFETVHEDGSNLNVSLLGLPEENDWILHGPYSDKTLMRNALSYHLAKSVDLAAMRTRFCELVINNDYKGVYVLIEKIKRDKNRVDMAELTPADVEGDQLTGGYMLKIDWGTGGDTYAYTSPYPANNGAPINFQYEEPELDLLQPQQADYIRNYVTAFEDALISDEFTSPVSGYRQFANVQSFIDYWIINEACKNIDAYRLSTFFYKDKDSKDGRLTMGPVWDFNLSLGNADYLEGWMPQNWYYSANESIPFWWNRLMQDSDYTNQLQCRWQDLRQNKLHTDTVLAKVDEWVSLLTEAQKRNFERWPTLGYYVWPNPVTPPTYAGEIAVMRNWIIQRLEWMDSNMPGECLDIATFRGKIFLQGSFDSLTNTMSLILPQSGLLPADQPFNTSPHDYDGGEIAETPQADICDWVLIELFEEGENLPVGRRAALLSITGMLRDVNGKDFIEFPSVPKGNYYVGIKAPGHVGVVSSNPISLPNYDPYNFTIKAGRAMGKTQLSLSEYYFGLAAGDADENGVVTVNDQNRITYETGSSNVYSPADLNRDGQVNEEDRILYEQNKSFIGVKNVRH
ncbi:MAG: CotH kinase family protein [Sphingobacteriales bacterium]|nr:MAG: CotH kinase family protein [Sphingobacteriales bacterium]